ncbi:MAG: hypothetical protein UV60_C0011G0007 [Parcubacteria group bacterium GW2011_GWA2_43_11]|nr:MAG: hypothetical protein UU89_C0046G0008 [Parcubacteria group bacterium GW2011_GWC2_42_11]KKS85107.1 MAG: hypothetical protein UV60_C0011G0007 [Parcubacteria group bacterium GW2011_GWA2_43_11]
MCEAGIGTKVRSIISFILWHCASGGCDTCTVWVDKGSVENPVIIAIARLEKILEDPHQHESDKLYAEYVLVDLMRNENVCLDYVDAAYAVLVRSTYSLSDETRTAIASFEAEPENAITVEMLREQRKAQ